MHEKHKETKYSGHGIRRDKRKEYLPDDTSDNSSLFTDEDDGTTMAEDLFSASASSSA